MSPSVTEHAAICQGLCVATVFLALAWHVIGDAHVGGSLVGERIRKARLKPRVVEQRVHGEALVCDAHIYRNLGRVGARDLEAAEGIGLSSLLP
jgi:hypothetical protein